MENRAENQPDPDELRFKTLTRRIRRVTKAGRGESVALASESDGKTHLVLSESGNWSIMVPQEDIADNYGPAPFEDVIDLFASVTNPDYERILLEGLERRDLGEGVRVHMVEHREQYKAGLLAAMDNVLNMHPQSRGT